MTARTSRFLLIAGILVTSLGGASVSGPVVTVSEASGPAARDFAAAGPVILETGAASGRIRWQLETTPLD